MKKIKYIFIFIGMCGFVLAYITAGASDMEIETGRVVLSNAQIYIRMATSAVLLLVGYIGTTKSNFFVEKKKKSKSRNKLIMFAMKKNKTA